MSIKRSFKSTLLGTVAGAAVLVAAVQLFPALVSDDLESYLHAHDMPLEYKNLPHTRETRLYHRNNPLTILHYGAVCAVEKIRDGHSVIDGIGSYFHCASVMTDKLLHQNAFDGFCTTSHKKVADRENYVRPQGYYELNDILRHDTGIAGLSYNAVSNQRRLSQYMREFTLDHELRHADQDNNGNTIFLESDADLAAIKAVSARHQDDPAVTHEMTELVKAMRVIKGLTNDPVHMSTSAIERGATTPAQSTADEIAARALISKLEIVSGDLKDIPGDLERRYHAARSIEANPSRNQDLGPGSFSLLSTFTRSVEYLNAHTETPIITRPDRYRELAPSP